MDLAWSGNVNRYARFRKENIVPNVRNDDGSFGNEVVSVYIVLGVQMGAAFMQDNEPLIDVRCTREIPTNGCRGGKPTMNYIKHFGYPPQEQIGLTASTP
jgi:hypothetical protein